MNDNLAFRGCGAIVLKDSGYSFFFINHGVSSVENPHLSDPWITHTHIIFIHRINAQVNNNLVFCGCGAIVLKNGGVLFFYEPWCQFCRKPPPIGSTDHPHLLSQITVPAVMGVGFCE